MTIGGSGAGEMAEQLALLPEAVRRQRAMPASITPAPVVPVARVLVDVPVSHLDRPYDYAVSAALSDVAQPGVRVKVRFSGADRDGYIVDRVESSDHDGPLTMIRSVVSPVSVLPPASLALMRAVADHYGGTVGDVVRLGIPKRHATTEKRYEELRGTPNAGPTFAVDRDALRTPWRDYRGGEALLARLEVGESPRAAWSALPGRDELSWESALVSAAIAVAYPPQALVMAKSALIVVPDARDVARVEAVLRSHGLAATHDRGWVPGVVPTFARLAADDGPTARYRGFLAALHGDARIVVGTRSAAFAPVPRLGLAVCWDDGDSLLAEPRSPYPHARDVLVLRAKLEDSALILGGFARTCEAQLLVESGFAREVVAELGDVRRRAPRIEAPSSVDLARDGAAGAARLPSAAHRLVREALERGPVLVQVPRRGYVPAVACARCRQIATCTECHGPLELLGAQQLPRCKWCARLQGSFECTECHGRELRSVRVGSLRTAEELGRAFPKTLVMTSGGGDGHKVLDSVDASTALVVATPGAEPVAAGGYAAALLLDAGVLAGRPDLRAGEDAVRHWLAASALVRGREDGGRVMLVGEPTLRLSQTIVRWDPVGYASRELEERRELALPPAVALATVIGSAEDVRSFKDRLVLFPGAELLGPAELPAGATARAGGRDEDSVRLIVRAPLSARSELAATLRRAAILRGVHKDGRAVRISIDPREFL